MRLLTWCRGNPIILTLIFLFILWMTPLSFKVFTIILVMLFFIHLFVYRSVFASLMSFIFMSAQFPLQGKFYDYLIIDPGRVELEPFYSEGVVAGFGFTGFDLLCVALLFFIGKYVFQYYFLPLSATTSHVYQLKQSRVVMIFVICWFIFIALSLYSSTMYSSHPINSVLHLFGYATFLLMIIAGIGFRKISAFLHGTISISLLASTLLFQSIVGLLQIIMAATKLNENVRNEILIYLPEQNSLLARPTGTFDHPNQFGFILLLCLLALFHLRPQLNKITRAAILFGFIMTIASQSRTIWAIESIIGVILFLNFHRKIIPILTHWRRTKSFILSFYIVLFFSTIIILPRLANTRYTLFEGSGSIRVQMIREGFLALTQRPWTGYGIDTNVSVMFEQFPTGYISQFPFDVHMAYLQFALESGVVATAAFFLPFIYLVWLRHKKNFLLKIFCFTVFMYYALQPHGGKNELLLLGFLVSIIA